MNHEADQSFLWTKSSELEADGCYSAHMLVWLQFKWLQSISLTSARVRSKLEQNAASSRSAPDGNSMVTARCGNSNHRSSSSALHSAHSLIFIGGARAALWAASLSETKVKIWSMQVGLVSAAPHPRLPKRPPSFSQTHSQRVAQTFRLFSVRKRRARDTFVLLDEI